MAAPSRAAQFSQMHKVLKKHFKPTPIHTDRSVLEHILFACLAENAYYQAAEEAYAAIVETYYDWNEVRVTTIRELAEVMARLPDPAEAASRMRLVLQHVFENGYVFDLEHLRKQNLGPTVADLKKIKGASPFAVSYVVQAALGGHAIPLDSGTLQVLQVLDFATDKEVEEAAVAGLERAIPKNKGAEFGSLLHELGASFVENPFAASLKKILLEINPDAKDRLPKRGEKEKEPVVMSKATKETETSEAKKPAGKKVAAKKTVAKKAEEEKPSPKKVAKRKIVPTKKKVTAPPKKSAKKVATKKAPEKTVEKTPEKTPDKALVKKAPVKKPAKKEAPAKKSVKKSATKTASKKSSKGIAKRKPR